jgi:diguanylate cyclase (GGDEF)-like protein/PAS domain S-box-containing protein
VNASLNETGQTADLSAIDPIQLVAMAPDVIFVLDTSGRLLYVNPEAEIVFGTESAQYLGRSMLDFLHPDDAMLAISSLETVRSKRVGTPIELRIAVPGGPWHWFEVIGKDCVDVPGVNGVLFSARDLTQRRMWEVAANDVVRFQQILQHAAAIVLSLDADGAVTAANGALTRLLGIDPSVVIGTRLSAYAAPGHRRKLSDAIASAAGAGTATVEVPMQHAKADDAIPIRFEIVNLLDDPVVASFVVTGQDVSDLDAARRRLEHLATHDSLTGLCNRGLLAERLSTLVEARRPLALLYVDLDDFKPVNDTYGHDVGDEVLRLVARRLIDCVGDDDLVARVGGDEFVVLSLGVVDRVAAVELADRLEHAVGAPYDVSAGEVRIGASVGSVVAGPESTGSTLLAEADLAMYAAKTARDERV